MHQSTLSCGDTWLEFLNPNWQILTMRLESLGGMVRALVRVTRSFVQPFFYQQGGSYRFIHIPLSVHLVSSIKTNRGPKTPHTSRVLFPSVSGYRALWDLSLKFDRTAPPVIVDGGHLSEPDLNPLLIMHTTDDSLKVYIQLTIWPQRSLLIADFAVEGLA